MSRCEATFVYGPFDGITTEVGEVVFPPIPAETMVCCRGFCEDDVDLMPQFRDVLPHAGSHVHVDDESGTITIWDTWAGDESDMFWARIASYQGGGGRNWPTEHRWGNQPVK